MLKSSYPGKLIVIEGLDGSGQSTQAELLRKFLTEKGYQVVVTKEPTLDSEAGRKIRDILDSKIDSEPEKLQELFAQDRKEHLENLIIPALKEGRFVISDRYFFSSFAFGASDGVDLEWLIKLNDNFLLPDLTFILKVGSKVCVSRIEKRGNSRTLFEKEGKLTKVWEIFKIMPMRFENVEIIDGEKSIEEVFEEVKKVVNSKL